MIPIRDLVSGLEWIIQMLVSPIYSSVPTNRDFNPKLPKVLKARARRKDNNRLVIVEGIAKVYRMRGTVVYITVDTVDKQTRLIAECDLIKLGW